MQKIFCPHCRRWLFKISYTGQSYIEIKCKCGEIVKVKLSSRAIA